MLLSATLAIVTPTTTTLTTATPSSTAIWGPFWAQARRLRALPLDGFPDERYISHDGLANHYVFEQRGRPPPAPAIWGPALGTRTPSASPALSTSSATTSSWPFLEHGHHGVPTDDLDFGQPIEHSHSGEEPSGDPTGQGLPTTTNEFVLAPALLCAIRKRPPLSRTRTTTFGGPTRAHEHHHRDLL